MAYEGTLLVAAQLPHGPVRQLLEARGDEEET